MHIFYLKSINSSRACQRETKANRERSKGISRGKAEEKQRKKSEEKPAFTFFLLLSTFLFASVATILRVVPLLGG